MGFPIDEVVAILRETVKRWKEPIITEYARTKRDPFRILISTIISLRTKDDVTREASERLFALADTPRRMMRLGVEKVADAIYPAGFYKNKSQVIIDTSRTIVEKFKGKVPRDIETLLSIKGVGRKTANLVVTLGYNEPGICVDTHVHRITNRWGYVRTKTPHDTEFALRKSLPKEYWIEINDILVTFGQNMCKPVSPHCSKCPVHVQCARNGVAVYR